jgi:hypothetical protein
MSPWIPAIVMAMTIAACVAIAVYFVEYVR